LTDSEGGEVSSDTIWRIFQDEYLPMTDASFDRWGRYELFRTVSKSAGDGVTELKVDYRRGDETAQLKAVGNGPIDAFINGLNHAGHKVTLFDYVEHAMSGGGDAVAAAYVDLEVDGQRLWGVGIDPDTTRATLKAIVSSLNRAVRSSSDQRVAVGA
jgi:2-isopropylmalate synthase